jgi:uncharacterized membrane protein HdeD (DUF308 family)
MLLAGRALFALALGLAITFTSGHTAAFGLVAFGVYALASGALILAGTFGRRAAAEARTAFRASGIVSVVAGVAALVLPSGGIGYLVWLLSGWAIVTGALELVSGIRARHRIPGWSDWIIVGSLTVLLGIVVLATPPDIADYFSGDKGVEGLLTSSIILVGMLGAWAVITGVLQAIAAASPNKTAARPAQPATASDHSAPTPSAPGATPSREVAP